MLQQQALRNVVSESVFQTLQRARQPSSSGSGTESQAACSCLQYHRKPCTDTGATAPITCGLLLPVSAGAQTLLTAQLGR